MTSQSRQRYRTRAVGHGASFRKDILLLFLHQAVDEVPSYALWRKPCDPLLKPPGKSSKGLFALVVTIRAIFMRSTMGERKMGLPRSSTNTLALASLALARAFCRCSWMREMLTWRREDESASLRRDESQAQHVQRCRN